MVSLTKFQLFRRYAVFALLSMGVNIGTQRLILWIYRGRFAIYLAMACGTGLGLLTKYILDKRYIFYYVSKKSDFTTFFLYISMGVVTTGVFWGTELVFNSLFTFPWAKYLGAGIGLTAGYILKYFLDKRFVFRR